MDGIGTGIGSVHRQRQGTGLATVLQGDQAVDTYAKIWQYDQARRDKQEADRAAKRNAALGQLKNFKPEWFYKHDAEMKQAMNEYFNKGAALLAKYDDPFTSIAPDAVEWQKERARIEAMSNASMQVKDQWTKYQQQALGANPDDYDARSLANAMSYFDTPLSEIVSTGATPPTLMKKRPYLDTMKFMSERMSGLQSAKGEAPSEDELRQFTKGLISDQANQQQLIEGYGSRMAQMSPDEKKSLEERALSAGVSPTEQLMFEDGRRYMKSRTPLNLQQEISQAAQMATSGIDYVEYGNAEASGKTPKGKKEAIAAAVEATFNSDPRYMDIFNKEGLVPRGAEASDAEYARDVKAYMATLIEPLVKTQTEYRKTDKGSKDAELRQSQEQFIADIRSGDTVRMQAAANALVGEKFTANLTVDNAVIQNQGGGNYWLELDVVTPMSVKDVKDQIVDPATGITSEDVVVEERQGKKIVKIGLAPRAISNQLLLSVLGDKKYDTKFTERSARTAIDAIKMPANTNSTSKAPTVGADFFK